LENYTTALENYTTALENYTTALENYTTYPVAAMLPKEFKFAPICM
jgi:hypothetical protein